MWSRRSVVATGIGVAASALASIAALGCAEEERKPWEPQDLVIADVTVVDVRTGTLEPGMTIVVDDGRIVEVAPAGAAAVGGAAKRVAGTGRYVVPGFNDLHAHPLQGDAERNLTMMLAHGITGFRQMAGTDVLLDERKRGRPFAKADAPELLAMPGLPLLGLIAKSPDGAVAEVREQRAAGADFIKVAHLPSAEFMAALEEAKALGLPFVGHLPPTVDAYAAAQAGMRAIEHLGPGPSLLLSCSGDETALRKAIASLPSGEPPGFLPPWLIKLAMPLLEGTLERFVANPMLHTEPAQLELIRRVVDTYDEAKCVRLAEALAHAQVWQTPTLVRVRASQLGDDPVFLADPNLRFVAPETRSLWEDLAQQFAAKFSTADHETFRRLFELQRKLTGLFDRAGVPMLAGSDACGAQWLVPGISLHEELDLLAAAGLAPLTVLRMTTLEGARFLGREATMGTVEPGRDANLVLLSANPLESVSNLHAVDAVVRAGRYYARSDLDALREASARH
jgi:imidazolonepropionase-like amidohydrolase